MGKKAGKQGAQTGKSGSKGGSEGGAKEGGLEGGPRAPDGGVDLSREQALNRGHAQIFGRSKSYQSAYDEEPLTAVDLVPDQPGFIVTVENIFRPEECARLRALMDQVGLHPATEADKNPRKNEAYLDRESLTFRDEVLEQVLMERLGPLMPAVEGRTFVGFLPRWRYYIYRKGQRFGQHVDVSSRGAGPGEETEYTLLVYLNGQGDLGLEGGDTVFWATAKRQLAVVTPRQGLLMLHAHGRRCLLHEGAEVTKGLKYVLRTDVMYRRDK